MSESMRDLLVSIAGLMDDRRQEGGRWDAWEASVRERIAAELIADERHSLTAADAIPLAWAIIANADWSAQSPEWIETAERWADKYVAAAPSPRLRGDPAPVPTPDGAAVPTHRAGHE